MLVKRFQNSAPSVKLPCYGPESDDHGPAQIGTAGQGKAIYTYRIPHLHPLNPPKHHPPDYPSRWLCDRNSRLCHSYPLLGYVVFASLLWHCSRRGGTCTLTPFFRVFHPTLVLLLFRKPSRRFRADRNECARQVPQSLLEPVTAGSDSHAVFGSLQASRARVAASAVIPTYLLPWHRLAFAQTAYATLSHTHNALVAYSLDVDNQACAIHVPRRLSVSSRSSNGTFDHIPASSATDTQYELEVGPPSFSDRPLLALSDALLGAVHLGYPVSGIRFSRVEFAQGTV